MQKPVHRAFIIILGVVFLTALVMGCSLSSEDTGTVRLSLTDAPIADANDVEGVFITITSIEYNLNGEWIEDTGFEGPQEFNLLDLTGGVVAPLSHTIIPAGEVSQIRFMMDVQKEGSARRTNPGAYILFDPEGATDGIDDSDVKRELFVPSGGQTGYKAVGSFTIPKNGEVEITADFDVRKSVVKRGTNDEYILKPTIRLVVNNQAGTIEGDFLIAGTTYESYTVFVYEEGAYSDSEALPAEIDDPDFIPFENATSSASVDTTTGSYILPFLASGTYDLVIAGVGEDGSYTVIDSTTYTGIVVEAEKTTEQDISL